MRCENKHFRILRPFFLRSAHVQAVFKKLDWNPHEHLIFLQKYKSIPDRQQIENWNTDNAVKNTLTFTHFIALKGMAVQISTDT